MHHLVQIANNVNTQINDKVNESADHSLGGGWDVPNGAGKNWMEMDHVLFLLKSPFAWAANSNICAHSTLLSLRNSFRVLKAFSPILGIKDGKSKKKIRTLPPPNGNFHLFF